MGARLLLINPKFAESFWSFKWAVDEILPGKRAINPPLGLATLAALCPPHWQVEIVDENIEPVPLAPQADIIGVCGMQAQFTRQRELLEFYRSSGYFVVAGGSYASLCPEKFSALADSVVAGEAEYIWPEFCRDFEHARPRALYRETGTVALADSPAPRFDLLKLEYYTTATLQFSRGCPFRCEFCDIIVMFGRKPRMKSNEQIGRELDLLRARGACNVFFVDDNLIGNKAAAKDLLRFLRDYQQRHGYRFNFGTEASINMAQDKELLELFREANFIWVFIGIESPDEATLRATRKTQNIHEDPLTALRRIYAHGIDVLAGFIVGFDGDTLATFQRQYRFIVASGIQVAMVGLLTALPRTPLYERVKHEGRLIEGAEHGDNTKPRTNIVPRHMAYDEMVAAYMAFYRKLTGDRAIAQRVRNKLRYLGEPIYHGEYPWRERVGIIAKLLKGVLKGGLPRLFHFARSMPWLTPAKLPLATVDWIAGLAMRDYVERYFVTARADATATLGRLYGALQRAIRTYLRRGAVTIELDVIKDAVPSLSICLKGQLDRAFFVRTARRVGRLLARTPTRLVLDAEHLPLQQLKHLQLLLKRLARHSDRVFIAASSELKDRIAGDLARFNLLLAMPHETSSVR
ncbi:MAG: B12-binding domain-containing radical SAM protein [Betaproteobacteria bacterium RIFCSPLOWO2_12_FULL_62_58]|nr:MAG: B12-binding domain-containing radical SAM protein [Betaproteobacteria bacterium RIFCSPLOWO2_12_FULL_62_58]